MQRIIVVNKNFNLLLTKINLINFKHSPRHFTLPIPDRYDSLITAVARMRNIYKIFFAN